MESIRLEEQEALNAKGTDGTDGRAALLRPAPLDDTSFRVSDSQEVAEEERPVWRPRDSSKWGEKAWIKLNAI